MADEEDKANKTEEPTETKLRKARQKGDVPSSMEAGNMMIVFSLFTVVVFVLPHVSARFFQSAKTFLDLAAKGGSDNSDIVPADVGFVLLEVAKTLTFDVGPIFMAMIVSAVIGILLQGETVVAMERIIPKASKISPIGGLKKMFSVDRFVDFTKNVIKVLVVGAFAFYVAKNAIQRIWRNEGFVPEELLSYIATSTQQLLILAAAFLVPIAIFDIIWKRMQWIKKQRMTIREIKDEHKDAEGDPKIKAMRAELRRKRSNQRIAAAVPKASVIITNPTHYAVALKYELGVDVAPVCVAKGADHMAARIRELAVENDVPMIENRPLARSLHANVQVDEQVPVEHWQVVAEIVGYVMDMKRNVRRKPPQGSSVRLHAED